MKQVINFNILLSLFACIFLTFSNKTYLKNYRKDKEQICLFASNGVEDDSTFLGNRGEFIDKRDGKKYNWARIGPQIWMIQNLAFKTDTGCYAYKNRWMKAKNEGYLYSWETAQKVAPEGWHLPSISEYMTLLRELCNDSAKNYNFYYCIKRNANGLNLNKIHGVYFSKEKIYFKGIIGYQYTGYWTSDSSLNTGRNKNIDSYGIFEFSEFWDFAGITSVFYESKEDGYLVRCIKNSHKK